MPRWLVVLGSGVGSAIAGTFLFYWVNNFHQVNGVGLLERQVWPVNTLWAWTAAGFALGSVTGLVKVAQNASHDRAARELAESLGCEYSESLDLPSGADSMPLFAGWSCGWNAMAGEVAERPATMFDYRTITGNGDSQSRSEGTVLLLWVDGLPPFELRSKTFGRRLLGLLGFEGLTFDASSADAADTETVRRFGERFRLSTTDGAGMVEAAGNGVAAPGDEAPVRALFGPDVMAAINEYPAVSMQSRPGFLAVWLGSGLLSAGRRVELWTAATQLREALTTPNPSRTALRPREGTELPRQSRRMQRSLLGGAVGLFGGFILSSMAMPVLFFIRMPLQGGGADFFLDFVLYGLTFLGLIALGASVGALIGSRLPDREPALRPPEDPARLGTRRGAVGCGAVVGFFGGFFGGFALFAASKIYLDWKLDNFGLEGAIFFFSIFGGALFGAVGVGWLVHRWHLWRAGPR